MSKLLMSMTMVVFASLASADPTNVPLTQDITEQLPQIKPPVRKGFDRIPDVAQYKGADWSHVVGISRGISLDQAFQIANDNPDITFFFYTKGVQMILEKENGEYRRFRHGDAVFFTGEPWWGSASGLADGYIKKATK